MDPNKYKSSSSQKPSTSSSSSSSNQPSTSSSWSSQQPSTSSSAGASSSSWSSQQKHDNYMDKSLSKDKRRDLFFKDQSGLKSFKECMYDRSAFDNKWKESKEFLGSKGMHKFLNEKDSEGWKARDGAVFWSTYDHLKTTRGTFTRDDHRKEMEKAYKEDMPMKYAQLRMERLNQRQDDYKKDGSGKKK